jgi:rhodanese-related sulfurtransferase
MINIYPKELGVFLQCNPETVLVDIRFEYEREENGFIARSHHIPWYTPDWETNPDFVSEMDQIANRNDSIVIICRSGHRSLDASNLLKERGFVRVFNLARGYEGLVSANDLALARMLAKKKSASHQTKQFAYID